MTLPIELSSTKQATKRSGGERKGRMNRALRDQKKIAGSTPAIFFVSIGRGKLQGNAGGMKYPLEQPGAV